MEWFFSDPHFDHENIILFCNRPFESVEDMNNTLLHNYNVRVKPDDIVYFLGDMAFGRDSRKPKWWLSQLNGKIHYIKGSHDNDIHTTSVGLNAVEVADYKLLEINGQQVLLIHDPLKVDPSWQGWVVHGHVHNYEPVINDRRINVSADVTGFRPVTLHFIAGIIYKYSQALDKTRGGMVQ